jgi:hypothetical protein
LSFAVLAGLLGGSTSQCLPSQWLAAAVLDRNAVVQVWMDVLAIDGLYQAA